MKKQIKTRIFKIDGMTCNNCETKLESALKDLNGIEKVEASYVSSSVTVSFDSSAISEKQIIRAINIAGYAIANDLNSKQFIGIVLIILAIFLIINYTVGFNFIPTVSKSMGYGLIFVVGLLTSLHCVAMCGGINVSVCINKNREGNGVNIQSNSVKKIAPSIQYNLGRVISYTIIGGIVGGIGAAFSVSPILKTIIMLLAGFFMIIMGLNMLNVFRSLKKFNIRMPKFAIKNLSKANKSKNPVFVGMLNGLMPCGPLQAMQLYALGTGGIVSGATAMLVFGLGTVPLMFGLGALSSFLSGKFTRNMLKISSVIVIILGLIMVNRGLVLSGNNITDTVIDNSIIKNSPTSNIARISGGIQTVSINVTSGGYDKIIVQKGIPVKWTIKATQENLNGCNSRINVPEFNIENKQLLPGDNVIEFTPKKTGEFGYSCWMGMISSSIQVVPDVTKVTDK